MNKLTTTNDQSHSVLSGQFQEAYHSKFGAIQESLHVFIDAGLKDVLFSKEQVRVLEVGFGTGLNVLLTHQLAQKTNKKIDLTSLEAYPLEAEIFNQLNYTEILGLPKKQLYELHSCDWDKTHDLSSTFSFRKIKIKLEDWIPDGNYDVIFFDAFSPDVQPELWTPEIFQKLYDCLLPQGVLVTYSAKGALKRALKAAGFTVEKLPGPPGKREMTRGVKV